MNMDEIKNNEDFQYIKERVKERPINRKKLMRRTIITALMAVIFGVLACFTFLVLEPVFTNILHPEQEAELVVIPEDTDEILPEDMKLEEEVQTTIKVVEKNTSIDPLKLYGQEYEQIYAVAQSTLKSTVTLTSVTQDRDWFDNEYENKGVSSALYVAYNKKEFLFLAYTDKIKSSENITVTFYDGTVSKGSIKQSDPNTGLSIVSVLRDDVPLPTKNNVIPATLANSRVSNILATPVIAIGRPYGNAESVAYGILTSKSTYAYLQDQNYQILTTDIYGSSSATGIIVNIRGEVLGIIDQDYSPQECPNLISALGISDLKKTIERMSNGKELAYLGVTGMDVSAEVRDAQGVPAGAFVTNIIMSSPAMNAGIQSGDVIVKIDGMDIGSYSDLIESISSYEPDTTVNIKLKRQSGETYQDIDIEVTLRKAK